MRNANLLRITTTPATLYVIRNHRGFSFAHRFLWQCHLVSAFAVAEREGPYSSIAPTDMILRTRSITSIVARHWTVVPYHPGGARYMSHPLTHPLDLSTLDITCVIAKAQSHLASASLSRSRYLIYSRRPVPFFSAVVISGSPST